MLKFIRHSLFSLAILSIFAASMNSAFADNKPMDQLRVAIVDVQAAILQTNEGKAAREKLEKEVAQKRQDLLNQQNNLKKLQEEFQAQQSILSEGDKQSKQKEFQTKL